MANSDKLILEEVYTAFGGNLWREKWNLKEEDLAKWPGVTTNSDGRVTHLQLEGFGLVGTNS